MPKVVFIALQFLVICAFSLFDAHMLTETVGSIFNVAMLKISVTLQQINTRRI